MYAHDAGSACSLVLLQVAPPQRVPPPRPPTTVPASLSRDTGDSARVSTAGSAPPAAGQQQPLRAGSSAAEASQPPPGESQVKPITREAESRVHSVSKITPNDIVVDVSAGSGGHTCAEPRAKPDPVHADLDGSRAGDGVHRAARNVVREDSTVPHKQQGNSALTKTPVTSNSNGGIKSISYAQALKSLPVSPEQMVLVSNSRSHTPLGSPITHSMKDRSRGSSRSSTPQINRPVSSQEHKEGAKAMLQMPSEGVSRSHSALSNLADISSESAQSESAQGPGRGSVEGQVPSPESARAKAALSVTQPSSVEKHGDTKQLEGRTKVEPCATKGAGPFLSSPSRLTAVPVSVQEVPSSSLGLKSGFTTSAEPSPVPTNVPNSATKIQAKPTGPPPGLVRSNPQERASLQGQAVAPHVTVFPQAVSDTPPTTTLQGLRKEKGLSTELELGVNRYSGDAPVPSGGVTIPTGGVSLPPGGVSVSSPGVNSALSPQNQLPQFPSAELQALNQQAVPEHAKAQEEAVRSQRLLQHSLQHYQQQQKEPVTRSPLPHSLPLQQRPPLQQQQFDMALPLVSAPKPIPHPQTPPSLSGEQQRPIVSATSVNVIHSPRAVKPSPTTTHAPPPPPSGLGQGFAIPLASPTGGLKASSPAVQAHSPSAFSPYSEARPVAQHSHVPLGSQQPSFASKPIQPAVPVGVPDRQDSSGHRDAQTSPSSESNKLSSSLSITAPPFVPSGGTQTPVSHSTPTSNTTPYSTPDLLPANFIPYPPSHMSKPIPNAVPEGNGSGLHVTPRQPPGFDRPVIPPIPPPPHLPPPPPVLDPMQVQIFQRVAQAQALAGLVSTPGLVSQPPLPVAASPEATVALMQLAIAQQQLQQQHHPPPRHPPLQRKPSLTQVLANPGVLQQLQAEAVPPNAVQVIVPQPLDQQLMLQHMNHEKPPGIPIKDSLMRKPAHPYVGDRPNVLAVAATTEMQARTLLHNTHTSMPNPSLAPYALRAGTALDLSRLPAPPPPTSQALLMQTKLSPSMAKRRPLLPTPPAAPSLLPSSGPFSVPLPRPHLQGVQVPFPTQDQQRPGSLYTFNPPAHF